MQHQIRDQILHIMSDCKDMTIATTRPDGAPQATVVSFVHDGLMLYFGCGASSQKAANIGHEPRVSVVMTRPYESWSQIEGLSMAARAERITEPGELDQVWHMMLARFPQVTEIETPPDVAMAVFCLRPEIVSVLDYAKGFGHTEMVRVEADDIAETMDSMRHHWLVPR
jgi:general stress protein 26